MTNVDTVRENTSVVDKKTNIRYLTAVFPRKYGYARHLAKRLNEMNKKSIMGFEYSSNIITQAIDKDYQDHNIEPELVRMAEEYTGLPIEKAAPNYVPAYSFI